MPTPTTTVTDYCGGLTRSRLLGGEHVRLLHDAWKSRGPGLDADVESFRRFLVAGRHLTEYQALLLQRGHVEGFLVGGYVILDRYGRSTYQAVHPASGQVVALHVLPSAIARQPDVLARFLRSGQRWAQLEHPNLIRAFHVGASGGVHFLAAEHLDGEPLDALLTRRPQLPVAEACRIIVQALHGLQHLHDRKIFHHDLKLSSLLLVSPAAETTIQSTVKIFDPGPHRLPSHASQNGHGESESEPSPEYRAPELARDPRTADGRADHYSLGCVLFHLLTGQPPFVEKNPQAAIVRHATEPPPWDLLPADAPPKLAAVLGVLLAKKPDDRFTEPRDAAEALRPFLPAESAPAAASRVNPVYLQYVATENREPQAAIGGSGPISSPRVHGRPGSGPLSSTRILAPRLAGPASSSRLGGSGPVALKPPSAAPRHAPTLPPPDPPIRADTDVELVPLTDARIVGTGHNRPLWELDRRDFLMLGIGSGIVIGAIAIGIFAAKFNADKIRRGPEAD